MRKLQYFLAALALTGAASVAKADTITNTVDVVASSVAAKFDLGATTGLSILGFLIGLGAIVTGIKVYRRR